MLGLGLGVTRIHPIVSINDVEIFFNYEDGFVMQAENADLYVTENTTV